MIIAANDSLGTEMDFSNPHLVRYLFIFSFSVNFGLFYIIRIGYRDLDLIANLSFVIAQANIQWIDLSVIMDLS